MTHDPLASIIYGIDACRGVIGICPSLRVYSGYDSTECAADNEPPARVTVGDGDLADWTEEQYSPEERRALADEMIRRWAAYRDAIKIPLTPIRKPDNPRTCEQS